MANNKLKPSYMQSFGQKIRGASQTSLGWQGKKEKYTVKNNPPIERGAFILTGEIKNREL